MQKANADYSNTLFYKISCKDTNITDIYIGQTTNFVQRKSGHKQGCNNPKYANYNLKLYNVIRQHGGWDNWRMDIIAYHECKDQYEARKKEQEYFILYNATLNSIEPMPAPKCVNTPSLSLQININDVKSTHLCDICNFSCFNTQDAFNLHINQNRHIKAVNRLTRLSTNVGDKLHKLGKEYKCEKCHYVCSNLTNFNKHLSTAKHIARQCSNNASQRCIIYTCDCGNTYKHRQSFNRHNKVCNYINEHSVSTADNMPLPPTIDAALVLELLKQNQEFKTIILEQNKQMMELSNQAGNSTPFVDKSSSLNV